MTDNIQELLQKIKDNINKVENKKFDNSVLDDITNDFMRFAELVKLFLISERDTYYGYILMNMRFSVDFKTDAVAGIKLNEFPPIFETNPLILCKFTLKEILYIFCHEIDHVVFNHPVEMIKSNPTNDEELFYLFNLAADAAVNDRLNNEIESENHFFLSAPDGVITSDVLEKNFNLKYLRKMENYEYYFSLIKNRKKEESPSNGKNSIVQKMLDNNKEENSSTDESLEESDFENQEQDNSNIKEEEIKTAKSSVGKLQDHNWNNGEDAEDTSAEIKELLNAAVDMMNEEVRGLMPQSFFSQIELINAPATISWEKLLKKYVGTIVASKRKTKMRLNRRQPERFDLSGKVDDKLLKLVVAIDTSGSVDDEMIARILNEIFTILAKRKHDITIIECDAKIQKVYKAKNSSEIQTKLQGRGGTLFSPVIKYINKNKFYRDALLIYFTDGFGEAEIPRPRTYRNMWVVFDNVKNLSLKNPYGVVLPLK